ncbi:MAG: LysR family transcriptional regulator [Defluviicoccus sp.]|nr:MAG: LysR family transcriptional regulator [Defluviicoccus sp.]
MSDTPSFPHITLEQWRALIAVVDAGGYLQAAEVLNKSQSAVTYAVQKIEALLGVQAFEIVGRKAVLTPTGQMLYRRARALVEEAGGLERAARTLTAGWEAEICLAVEILFPTSLLFQCLDRFSRESPMTRIEVLESVIRGTSEALIQRRADLAITPMIPPGFLGDPLRPLRLIAAAHPEHPLHQLDRPLTLQDLRRHRHLVVRDTGATRDRKTGTVEAEQRWTVSHMASSVEAACMGLGFAWFPEDRIRDELADGRLKPLPLREGGERWVQLYLVLADADFAGPGTRRLAEVIRDAVAADCAERHPAGGPAA